MELLFYVCLILYVFYSHEIYNGCSESNAPTITAID